MMGSCINQTSCCCCVQNESQDNDNYVLHNDTKSTDMLSQMTVREYNSLVQTVLDNLKQLDLDDSINEDQGVIGYDISNDLQDVIVEEGECV